MLENIVLDLNMRKHKLGNVLRNNKRIPVEHLDITREIPVRLKMYGPNSFAFVPNNKLRDAEALGLSIRRKV